MNKSKLTVEKIEQLQKCKMAGVPHHTGKRLIGFLVDEDHHVLHDLNMLLDVLDAALLATKTVLPEEVGKIPLTDRVTTLLLEVLREPYTQNQSRRSILEHQAAYTIEIQTQEIAVLKHDVSTLMERVAESEATKVKAEKERDHCKRLYLEWKHLCEVKMAFGQEQWERAEAAEAREAALQAEVDARRKGYDLQVARFEKKHVEAERDTLVKALRGPYGVECPEISRLSWLRSMISECRSRGPSADNVDPNAFWEMIHEVEQLHNEAREALRAAREHKR